jgi:hypothetical protein
MRHTLLILAAVTLVLMGAGLASATTITLSATGQGWINNGSHGSNGNTSTNNYIMGNCGVGDCAAGEFRNFFQFSIPSLSGTIISADLVLYTYVTVLDQSPSLTYQVTSLPADFGFNDLGTGTVYGTRIYTGADANLFESIALNADALHDIAAAAGGTFGLGGRVTSETTFDASAPDQEVFGGSRGSQELVINVSSVPEPASLLLFCSGVLGLAVWRRRRP